MQTQIKTESDDDLMIRFDYKQLLQPVRNINIPLRSTQHAHWKYWILVSLICISVSSFLAGISIDKTRENDRGQFVT